MDATLIAISIAASLVIVFVFVECGFGWKDIAIALNILAILLTLKVTIDNYYVSCTTVRATHERQLNELVDCISQGRDDCERLVK